MNDPLEKYGTVEPWERNLLAVMAAGGVFPSLFAPWWRVLPAALFGRCVRFSDPPREIRGYVWRGVFYVTKWKGTRDVG